MLTSHCLLKHYPYTEIPQLQPTFLTEKLVLRTFLGNPSDNNVLHGYEPHQSAFSQAKPCLNAIVIKIRTLLFGPFSFKLQQKKQLCGFHPEQSYHCPLRRAGCLEPQCSADLLSGLPSWGRLRALGKAPLRGSAKLAQSFNHTAQVLSQ